MILSDLVDWLPISIAAAGFVVAAIVILANQSLRSGRKMAVRQVPALLDLLARSLRAGASVSDAIGLVADMGPEPGRFEFQKCRRDLQNGCSLDEAVTGLAQRLATLPTDLLPAALCAEPDSGQAFEEGLELIERISTEAAIFRSDVRAFARPARHWAYIFLAIGPAAVCLMYVIGPAAFGNMFQSEIGIKLLSIALGLQVVGGLWIVLLLQLYDSLEFSTE